jgi:hypothetical protein
MKIITKRDLEVAQAVMIVFRNQLSGFTIQRYEKNERGDFIAHVKASGTMRPDEQKMTIVLTQTRKGWQATCAKQPFAGEDAIWFFGRANEWQVLPTMPIC